LRECGVSLWVGVMLSIGQEVRNVEALVFPDLIFRWEKVVNPSVLLDLLGEFLGR